MLFSDFVWIHTQGPQPLRQAVGTLPFSFGAFLRCRQ
jgi:hypothetical protein